MSGIDGAPGPGLWHDGYREFSSQLGDLYARCQATYHAFDDLPRLVDQLRILSVNAELASARAGDYGRAVRVLTHFATEAVTRLMGIIPEMIHLKRRTYAQTGTILRAARDVGKLEAAGNIIMGGNRPVSADSLPTLETAWRTRLHTLGEAATGLTSAHASLQMVIRSVREVVLQTEMVAANIAIEATAAGPFAADLGAIADVMHEHTAALRAMVDEASHGMRDAAQSNLAMAAFAGLGRQSRTTYRGVSGS
jgi:hypothetical protein